MLLLRWMLGECNISKSKFRSLTLFSCWGSVLCLLITNLRLGFSPCRIFGRGVRWRNCREGLWCEYLVSWCLNLPLHPWALYERGLHEYFPCFICFHQDNWDEDEEEKESEKDEDVDEENEEEDAEEKDENGEEDRDVASEKELNGDSDLDPENESEEEWGRRTSRWSCHLWRAFPSAAESSWEGWSLGPAPRTLAHFQIPRGGSHAVSLSWAPQTSLCK